MHESIFIRLADINTEILTAMKNTNSQPWQAELSNLQHDIQAIFTKHGETLVKFEM